MKKAKRTGTALLALTGLLAGFGGNCGFGRGGTGADRDTAFYCRQFKYGNDRSDH